MLPGQIISMVFAAIFLLLSVVGLFKGLGRGLGRQTVRAATIALSIIISVIVTTALSSGIANLCQGRTLDEVLMALNLHGYIKPEILDMLACYDAVTAERIIELPLMSILMPFIFAGCFAITSSLMLILHKIFCLVFRLSKHKKKIGSRLLGMLIGTIQGVVVAFIMLLPIMNIVGIAADTNDHIIDHRNGEVDDVEYCRIYSEYIEDTANNPLYSIAYGVAAESICDSFATIDIEGDKVNLRETLSLILVSVDDFIELGGFDWTSPTDEQNEALEQVIDQLSSDAYVASILSGALRGTANSIDRGVIVFKNLEEPTLGVMNSLVSIFTTLNEDNFAQDIDTIFDVYMLLSGEGVLSNLSGSSDDVTKAFTRKDGEGETVINRVIATIQTNDHMKPLITMLTKLSLSVMMDDVGIEKGEEVYDSINYGITTVLDIKKDDYATEEEYHAAVSSQLNETLVEHNINLASDIVDNMAKNIVDKYSDVEEVTDDIVNDVILSYYDSYIEYTEGSGEDPLPGITPDNPDEGGENATIPDGEGSGEINTDGLPEGILP